VSDAGLGNAATSGSAAARCRACSAEIAPGAARCDRCGAMQSDAVKCPHCGSVAAESPHAELRFRCDVCGAPRVPLAGNKVKRSGKEVPHLKRAEAARRARAGWRAAAAVAGAVLPFVLLLALLTGLIWSAGAAAVLAVVLGVPAGSLLALSVMRSRAQGKQLQPALDAAWLAVATDVAQQTPGALSAKGLAAQMGIDESQGEELLALLSVNDIVRSDVTDSGDIAYSRVRVGGVGDLAPDAAANLALAEHEAAEDEASLGAAKTMIAPVTERKP
jgi:hypothetical protein